LISLSAALHANAQTGAPCDASRPIKGCRAEIRLEGKFVVLRSDTPKCSVIEWTLDGSPRRTTVLDGQERIELLTTRPKELTVEDCTEVKDLRALRDSDDDDGASEMQAVSQAMPEYPPGMRRAGIEGRVVVEVQVRPNGSVGSARVVSSPDPLFSDAAIKAAYGWRYAPTSRGGVAQIAFNFKLAE
jgi:TonB family protein